MSAYRQAAPSHRELWDWDIIAIYSYLHIVGVAAGCLYEDGDRHFGGKCDCIGRVRRTSQIVGADGIEPPPMGAHGPVLTPSARRFLGCGEGDEIRVMSGKTYRLAGPRKMHKEYKGASIWEIAEREMPRRFKYLEEHRRSWGSRLRRLTYRLAGVMSVLLFAVGCQSKPKMPPAATYQECLERTRKAYWECMATSWPSHHCHAELLTHRDSCTVMFCQPENSACQSPPPKRMLADAGKGE